jgi:hypothetical protein
VLDGKLGTATGIELTDDGGFHVDGSGDQELDSGQLLMARKVPTLLTPASLSWSSTGRKHSEPPTTRF